MMLNKTGDTYKVFQLSEGSGITIGGASNNYIQIDVDNTNTDISGEFVYDLQIINDTSGKIHTLEKGDFIVNDDVTRTTS